MASPNTLKRLAGRLATLLVAAFVSTSAFCQNNLGTIFTDLWWNPSESGWGVTVDHQENTMFLTFFVYRADQTPNWMTATLTKVGAGPISGPITFAGDLYETHGPAYNAPFNPAAVTLQKVGTATFTSADGYSAALHYSINGANVAKNITRQTLSNVNYSGYHLGTTFMKSHDCKVPSDSNKTALLNSAFTISQSGTAFSMTADLYSTSGPSRLVESCSFHGTYSQAGSVGKVDGSYSCTLGERGSFTLSQLQWTLNGMTGAVNMQDQSCQYSGQIGGITYDHVQ